MNDTLYFGGPIRTMEEGLTPEAVLVRDGRIAAVGGKQELLAQCSLDTRRVDLEGQALLPAFLDPHSHISSFATTLGAAPLDGAEDFEDLVRRVSEFKRSHGLSDTDWIIGFGYDHNSLAQRRHPDKTLLDRVSVSNPILITHKSGHMGVANSAALAAMGVTADSPDPDGGVIGRMPGGSEPNGYLEETAFTHATSAIPQPSAQQLMRQFELAQDIYLQSGITTVQDGLIRPNEWKLLRRLSDEGRLKVDTVCYVDLAQHRSLLTENPFYQKQYRNRLKIGGYKIFLDGSPQGRTAWMSRPYEGGPEGYCGYPIHSDQKVREFFRTALGEKQQILVHCNGDAASQQMLDQFHAAHADLPQAVDIRPVMIHAQLVRDDQLDRMARAGMIASFFVAHTWYWGDVHLKNFGPQRGGHISPVKAALDRGVCYTFHQDTPVLPPDMPTTLWCAVNRLTESGVPIGPDQRVSVYDALKAVTVNAAYQYFEENEKGSIKPGKRADLVILDRDPLAIPPEELRGLRVMQTIKDGAVLYRREN